MTPLSGGGDRVHALAFEPAGPVGLAAGFDRDGSRVADAAAWGFGFVELGTITPTPVPGHNPGAAALAVTLARMRASASESALPLVGVNLGAMPGAALGDAWRDYVHGLRMLWPCADFLTLNFTSDASRGLRLPGNRHTLLGLLAQVRDARLRLEAGTGRSVPLLVKWPVGRDWAPALELVHDAGALGCDGVVAAWDAEPDAVPRWEAWVPQSCAALARAMSPGTTLVAAGGVDRVERAMAMHASGAHLVELHRGFAVRGQALVRAIDRALRRVRRPGACMPAT